MISGHYDTKIGGKKESASYQQIAADIGSEPGRILFVSDVVDELVAARSAGFQCALSVRPENHPVEAHDFFAIESFRQLQFCIADSPDG